MKKDSEAGESDFQRRAEMQSLPAGHLGGKGRAVFFHLRD